MRTYDAVRLAVLEDRARGVTYDEDWYGDEYFADHFKHRPWAYNAAWALRRHLQPKSALDVGCGVGLMVEAWRLEGVNAHGVDVSPAALAAARPEVRDRLRRCNLLEEPLPYPDGAFDLVTSIEVLEHLPAHANFAREAYRVLKPGGHLFIQTPKPGTPAADDPTHVAVKPKRDWVRLHEAAGFELADDHLLQWEHDLPMPWEGRWLGWLRLTRPVKEYVVRTGTRTLFRKPA